MIKQSQPHSNNLHELGVLRKSQVNAITSSNAMGLPSVILLGAGGG